MPLTQRGRNPFFSKSKYERYGILRLWRRYKGVTIRDVKPLSGFLFKILKTHNKVHSALGVGCGMENVALVVLQG